MESLHDIFWFYSFKRRDRRDLLIALNVQSRVAERRRVTALLHCKNIRISTDILWRVFHILTEPVRIRNWFR